LIASIGWLELRIKDSLLLIPLCFGRDILHLSNFLGSTHPVPVDNLFATDWDMYIIKELKELTTKICIKNQNIENKGRKTRHWV
jgi:hypothetical protein